MIEHDFGDRRSIAVVGAGVAGLTAAYVLAQRHEVTLYEADDRLGGHAHTHDVTDPDGNVLAVDTGFIVHNNRTYPHLRRLFAELGVETRPTEMSMSIQDERSGVEFAGGRGAKGVFAQPRRALDPRFLSVLVQVKGDETWSVLRGDLFVVPSWQPLTVACEGDGVDLFRFSDAPILERLGQYRVEVDG